MGGCHSEHSFDQAQGAAEVRLMDHKEIKIDPLGQANDVSVVTIHMKFSIS